MKSRKKFKYRIIMGEIIEFVGTRNIKLRKYQGQ